jgi:carboxypeptidase C (cathepsin A)
MQPFMKILPFFAALLLSIPLFAAEPGGSPSPADGKAKADESPKPEITTTEHTITVNGRVLKYKAVAGYITLTDPNAKPDDGAKPGGTPLPETGKPTARIFFIAYTLEGTDTNSRPVTFAFNGGPGAASVWLHLGQLGPRRVKLDQIAPNSGPPYSLVDNDQTWLTDTDLVFIDPVSTGFSRTVQGEDANKFHGYEPDIKSIADFIRLYITQNNRWLSPKFIVGESYGGTRAAGLCDYLQHQAAIYLDGVMVVSGLMNWEYIAFTPTSDISYCLALPSLASTAWYYKKDAPEYQQMDVTRMRDEVEQFATSKYLLALNAGDTLSGTDRQAIADQLSKYTGVDAGYILRHRLRLSTDDFREEVLKDDDKAPGRYDGRYAGLVYDWDGDIGDPSFVAIRGAFTATINSYLRSELKFESDLPYELLANVEPWTFGSENKYLDVSHDLAAAMTDNPRLKVWIMCGHYDLAVPYYSTVYTISHMNLDPSIRKNLTITEYDSGHMIYTDQVAMKLMRDDFGRFLKSAAEGP